MLAPLVVPLMFVAFVLQMRYLFWPMIDLMGDIFDLVRDFGALSLDAMDLMAYLIETRRWSHFPGSSLITPTGIQLLSLGAFVAFLAYLTASHPAFLPTRQSLQDLLDEAVRKIQETEDRLLDVQRFTDNLQAQYAELQSQNKRLQGQNERVNAENDRIRDDKNEHAAMVCALRDEIEAMESRENRLELSLRVARISLRDAERNADGLEQARKAADDKASRLTEELEKSRKRTVTARRVTKHSREEPDHTECVKSAAIQADQVDKLQKALEALQVDQQECLRRQASETSGLREALVDKEENHQALKQQVESLTVSNKDYQSRIDELEDSLAQKDASLQEAQAEILELSEQVEDHSAALKGQVESLTISIDDCQSQISQLEESLAASKACEQQAQATILDLKEQVEELSAAKGAAADLESVKVKSQRDEMDVSAAMMVDNPADGDQSKEIADLQVHVRQLQAALDQAQVALSAARPVGEEMDSVRHECDHSRCQQREVEQDGNLAKLQAISSAQEKKISELGRMVRELEFRLQGNSATATASPEAVSQEAAKLRKEKADNLARGRRDPKKEIKELEESLRAKNLELKELASELQGEKRAAATRVESVIREKMAGAKKAVEELKGERDRSRANNVTLLKRAVDAEAALEECQRQRERSMAEAGRLMGELRVAQGGAGTENPKKRELEEGEEGLRPSKVSRSDL